MSKNTNTNTAAATTANAKEMSTMSTIIRVAAATPFAIASAASFAIGEASAIAGKKIAGEKNWDKVPFSGYVKKYTAGFVFNAPSVEEALKEVETKKDEKQAEKADHSDMVEWKKGRWVPSSKAVEVAKKAGHEAAFLPQMYKAANWIIRVVKEGGDKVYSAANGETHTYLGWVYKNVFGHAEFMEGKGVENAKTAEKLKEYFEQACKHSKVEADKLPTWEQICAAVQAEQKLAKEEAEEGKEILAETMKEEVAMLEELPDQEVRDGRAPKTPTPAADTKMDVKSIVRSLGIVRLKEDNAWEVAEKAKAAFEAATLTEEEFYAVVDACQAKDAGADPEEYMALLGEN